MSHTAPRPVPSTSQLPNTHTASTSATLPPDPVGSGRHAATMAPSSGIQPSSAASFQIVVSGQLEACQFPGVSALLCRYEFVHGVEWTKISGVEKGITQTSTPSAFDDNTTGPLIVWNHPLDISFSTRSIYGWPQIVVAVYGPDFLGREVVQGYGVMHIPIAAGRYIKYLKLWAPQGASPMDRIGALAIGKRTEYIDPLFISRGAGREVNSFGTVKIALNVLTRGMGAFGYSEPEANSELHIL